MEQPKISAFLRVLDPRDNKTGGGAASAVAGAMAGSLVGMVARVSIGKKKLVYTDQEYEQFDLHAQELVSGLLEGSILDSKAFDQVMSSFKMPKITETEKRNRKETIQNAYITATEIPINNAELTIKVLKLADKLKGNSNINAASDLDCAFFLAEAGVRGLISNVEINLTFIENPEIQNSLKEKSDSLSEQLTQFL